ncbi:MAG: hypothetical protein Q8P67_21050, partial [archaeon]|nr:hypothetical protein [archaeon]
MAAKWASQIPHLICALNKPKGMVSQRALDHVKDVLRNRYRPASVKVTQKSNHLSVGHGGTLDPIASGVLVCSPFLFSCSLFFFFFISFFISFLI